MPEPDFKIKTGDTASSVTSTLENSGGTAVNIQGATILFKVRAIGAGTLSIAGTATILQVGDGSGTAGLKGQVSYAWPAGGISTPGLYLGEWETTFSTGTIQTFPNDSFVLIGVTEDL